MENKNVNWKSPTFWPMINWAAKMQVEKSNLVKIVRTLREWDPVRNMGNFNLSLTHVLTFLHCVEQCYHPSFLIVSHIPAMTFHVANVIHTIFTIITTQGLCNITFFLCFSSFLCIWDRIFLTFLIFYLLLISMLPYSLCTGSGIKSI